MKLPLLLKQVCAGCLRRGLWGLSHLPVCRGRGCQGCGGERLAITSYTEESLWRLWKNAVGSREGVVACAHLCPGSE